MTDKSKQFVTAYGGPVLLALIALLAQAFEPLSGQWLAYDRYAVEGMETWRLLTANIVHTNFYHTVLNLTGLLLLSLLHSQHYRIIRFWKVFLWCAVLTSVGIYFFSPGLIWYAGLSGALHGMFIWGACMDIRAGMKSGFLLLAGVLSKVCYEQVYGSSDELASLIDATVAVDAHLYGDHHFWANDLPRPPFALMTS